jgi:polar amino acid transport system substrate-binding protein
MKRELPMKIDLRKTLYSTFASALVIGGLATSATAAEIMAPSSLANKGQLTYAVAATFAPFEYMENGKLTGFDIDMITEISKRMGLEPNPMNMEFKGLIPSLQGKRADIINSGMYIKPERAAVVDFVPYMRVGNQLVVAAGNPKNIQGQEDLCGLKVAVTLGGFQEGLAKEQSGKCVAAGKKATEVLTYPSAQDAALVLKQGRADAIFNSTPGAVKQVTALPDSYAIGGNSFGPYFLVGFAVRKGESETKKALEAGLKSIQADGTFDGLLIKYKFPLEAKNLN